MSTSAECWDFSGRRLPQKPSFSQTCTRFSRYLKEKGSFGDLSLGMTCKPDVYGAFPVSRQPTMMNLFPCEASALDSAAAQDIKPNNMFPRQSSFSSSSSSSSGTKEDVHLIKETKSVKLESESTPLTIFYAGQVMVFDYFSAEEAKQVIDLANKGSAKSFTGFTAEVNTIQSTFTQTLAKNHKENASSPNPVRCPAKTVAQEPLQPNPSSLACELPIARRASLHRFLAKRKDRITSKAPYQKDGLAGAPSKPNPAWLGSQ